MKRIVTITALALALTGGAASTYLAITPTGTSAASIASTLHLSACPTEDSDNCYWDASTRGNGQGQSFAVINGTVIR